MPSPFPLGGALTLAQLEEEPHAKLARLREREPVSWVHALGGWLVTRHDLALRVLRDAATFTVDDPRFSTAQVIGPSMLSLDGPEHDRHREPFAGPFRAAAVHQRFEAAVAPAAARLIDAVEPAGQCELRRSFAGPLAAATITQALGMDAGEADQVLKWYDAIVAGVTEITRGAPRPERAERAFGQLRGRLLAALEEASDGESLLAAAAAAGPELGPEAIVSDAAVLLFGGIETTEGMIANAVLLLLSHPDALARVRAEPGLVAAAVEESLRLEPAAAVVDRYATVDVELAGAPVRRGDLVRVSLSAANRDPAVFAAPDEFDLMRGGSARRHLAFAQGPHVCLGVHLARLEARIALSALLERLPALRLDPLRPAAVRGLVFRKPPALHVRWD